jgi:alginate production protein
MLFALCLSLAFSPLVSPAPDDPQLYPPAELRLGHWIEVKGTLEPAVDPTGPLRFLAAEIELTEAEEYESLIGTIVADAQDPKRLQLLGQPVSLSERTEWTGIDPQGALDGQRVRIDGRYRGPAKLSARDVRAWGPGRDRVAGRIDGLRPVPGGIELELLRYVVFVPDSLRVECERDPASLPRIERRWTPAELTGRVDEDDLLAERFELAPGLRLGGQLEFESQAEDEYDLDAGDDEDRVDTEAIARLRLAWRVADDWFARGELKARYLWRDDDEDGYEEDGEVRLGENWIYWRDALPGIDVQVGRQDFDDPREWIYDQDLDGVRWLQTFRSTRLELAAATRWGGDADPRERDAVNLFATYSTLDEDRYLAAWSALRHFEDGSGDTLLHVGTRAIGDFLDGYETWLELGLVAGDEGGRDVFGFGFDLGGTYEWEEPGLVLSAGVAYGSGDDGSGNDGAFRQTGLQDNNGKLGTATSVRYYGELFDPELSNLVVMTAGVSKWIGERTTLALIGHSYRQVEAATFLRDAEVDAAPLGEDLDLGFEFDLVLGSRHFANFDLELATGIFLPGDAFADDAETASFIRGQVRWRF